MPIVRIADKLVYFAHVPRAAGTSVERYLRARFGTLAFSDPSYLSVPDEQRWTRSSPQHIDTRALSQLFPTGFFDAAFAVVRDPCHRLLSVFLRQRDIERSIPVDTAFCDWLELLPLPGHALDNHTRPMLDFIPRGSRIFRLEDGLGQVVKWLDGIAGNSDGPREIGVFNSHTQRLAFEGRDLATEAPAPELTPELRAMVAERYAADMFWCGYAPHTERTNVPDTPKERTTPAKERTVILHYHLFKNAGTSLDQILRQNFGDRWVTREFSGQKDHSTELADWICSEPEAVAFSTHTAMGPVPEIPGVRIVSVMLLRDPISRIRSAYRFERQQQADTYGANLAKKTDLEGYVRTRLAKPGDRQCRDFQTFRLASMQPESDTRPELDRALDAARGLTVLGSVADFDGAVADLARAVRDAYPAFTWASVQANVSKPGKSAEAPSPDLQQLLEEANGNDLALIETLFGSSELRETPARR